MRRKRRKAFLPGWDGERALTPKQGGPEIPTPLLNTQSIGLDWCVCVEGGLTRGLNCNLFCTLRLAVDDEIAELQMHGK